MVGQAMRFMESLVKVKDGVASGKLGAPGLLRVHRWESLGVTQLNGTAWRLSYGPCRPILWTSQP